MSLVSPKTPLPVGSFSKTNPPKNLRLPLRNPLPPKDIRANLHVRNGGFVSQKRIGGPSLSRRQWRGRPARILPVSN